MICTIANSPPNTAAMASRPKRFRRLRRPNHLASRSVAASCCPAARRKRLRAGYERLAALAPADETVARRLDDLEAAWREAAEH